MNYKIALSAALFAAVGLTGCDSRDNNRVLESTDIRSGATAPGADTSTNNTGVLSSANAPVTMTGTQEAGDSAAARQHYADEAAKTEAARNDRAVAPVPAQPTSGSTSEVDDMDDADLDESADADVYHSDDLDDDDVLDDDSVVSGSTSEPLDSPRESYRQTDLPGGMTSAERNLRFGLIGNGTGMGVEDTSSKFMTDNYTISDPALRGHALANSGALSAPTEDQDALKDIKSGTSFDPNNFYIEEEND